MTGKDNLDVYEQDEVVDSYAGSDYLTPAESGIITTLKPLWTGHLLDMGIGAGRTTHHLAPLAARYEGMDYSRKMVDYCRARFSTLSNASFLQDDARVLSAYEAATFDTAFFSFNGIDCVDYEGRNAVLRQVNRVLKPGGHFIFSFHNTGYLHRLYSYHWAKNPLYWLWNLKRMRRVKQVNGPESRYAGRPYFILKDGGENFQLDILYIAPEQQEADLDDAGFTVLHRFENASGSAMTRAEASHSNAASIYFVCRKK